MEAKTSEGLTQSEAKTQKKLLRYLKERGFYVIKTKPGPGTPVGCPDILAFHAKFWAAFEIKRSVNAPFRPLQQKTLDMLGEWSHVRVVYPENVNEIIAELDALFLDDCLTCKRVRGEIN